MDYMKKKQMEKMMNGMMGGSYYPGPSFGSTYMGAGNVPFESGLSSQGLPMSMPVGGFE